MTTHLFSNTFCKLEILFKLQRLKNERKEGKNGTEDVGGAGRRNASINKQRNAVCSINNTNSTV